MILIAVISLGAIGAIGAVFLYAASKKFEVYEDPRIAQVQEVLPGANCGGCGYPGCGGFATACVKADTLDGLLCPVGGAPVMGKVATILGKEAASAEPMVAAATERVPPVRVPTNTTVCRVVRLLPPCTAERPAVHSVA